ncbi:hypothetical protein Aasi_1881 [Candidatus Amoebophilus asiaticus 5a2]|uniref:Uncharacterized protein n=1 Tax=Amoebophilus asiaticus (strain 5a2) TaxID=452471 RepID=C3L471_AMOA5|nr:SEL1-like repeat protein [Candidatus Amoebophilus asiaticus]ACP21112.1 hypothetical protein Aasi_1881 [Candidatus Amoebophilus asiaticus 5a2]
MLLEINKIRVLTTFLFSITSVTYYNSVIAADKSHNSIAVEKDNQTVINKDNAKSLYRLGQAYYYGDGVPKSI